MAQSNMLVIAGAVIALAGVAGLAVPVFTTQQTNQVAKIGGLEIKTQESTAHAVPPLLSGGALVLGLLLVGGGLFSRRG